jgi:hypothetical protein
MTVYAAYLHSTPWDSQEFSDEYNKQLNAIDDAAEKIGAPKNSMAHMVRQNGS